MTTTRALCCCALIGPLLSGCPEALEKLEEQRASHSKPRKGKAPGREGKTKKKTKGGGKQTKNAKTPRTKERSVGEPAKGLTGFTCTSGGLSCDTNDCYEGAAGADNNREARATPLGFGAPIKAVACGKDWDWYRVKAPLGCTLEVELEHAEGDLDLYIYADQFGGGSTDRAHAKGEGRRERLRYVTRSDEEHRVAVVPVNGGGVYTLTARGSCHKARCPEPDAFEDEDGDERSNDHPSEATSGLRGDTLTAWLCDKDVDHYTLNVASLGAPCNPQAELRFDPSHSGAIQLDVMTTTGRWERAVVLRGAGWLKGHFGQKLSTTPIFKVSRTGSAQGALPYTIALGCAE